MYAWPNILSAWDPYGHTNNIKVAEVTEDSGAGGERTKSQSRKRIPGRRAKKQ